MWMAKESGGFAKEGLDVEMISMSSVLALPALIANEVDVIQVSAVPARLHCLVGVGRFDEVHPSSGQFFQSLRNGLERILWLRLPFWPPEMREDHGTAASLQQQLEGR